jgi:hypothetical protein
MPPKVVVSRLLPGAVFLYDILLGPCFDVEVAVENYSLAVRLKVAASTTTVSSGNVPIRHHTGKIETTWAAALGSATVDNGIAAFYRRSFVVVVHDGVVVAYQQSFTGAGYGSGFSCLRSRHAVNLGRISIEQVRIRNSITIDAIVLAVVGVELASGIRKSWTPVNLVSLHKW